jgi:hypothetical protein
MNFYDLDDWRHNPFVGFGLIVFFTYIYYYIRGFLRVLKDKSAKRRASQPAQSPPAYASADHAAAVHSFANQEFFQLLLGVMRKNLTAEGYDLTQDQYQRITLAPKAPGALPEQCLLRASSVWHPGSLLTSSWKERMTQSKADMRRSGWKR